MENGITMNGYCIIEKDNAILMTQDEGKEGWKLPGGEIKDGEMVYDGIKREVKEETNLDVELTSIVCIQEYVKENSKHRFRIYVAGAPVGGETKTNPGEVKKIEWISREELGKLAKDDFFISQYYLATREYLSGKRYPLNIIEKFKR